MPVRPIWTWWNSTVAASCGPWSSAMLTWSEPRAPFGPKPYPQRLPMLALPLVDEGCCVTDPRFPHKLTRGSYGCSICRLDFASEEAFDGHCHFTGREGDWIRRKCIHVQSHEDWVLDSRSRWDHQGASRACQEASRASLRRSF
jgi:hypothetical protein